MSTMAGAVFDPEGLAIAEPVVPVRLLPTMSVLPWMKVAGYDRLVRHLLNSFRLRPHDVDTAHPRRCPVPDASVLLFPYDFRQGMAYNAERLGFEIDRRVGNRRVIVVGHSMGGLVARWWWAVLGGHRICRALITVGTPHRGAPKAIDWLLNGIRLGPRPVAAMTSRLLKDAAGVLTGWESTWELLPRYRAIRDRSGPAYPHEVSVAPESFRTRAKAGYDHHVELGRECTGLSESAPATRARFMAFYATGHATWARSVVDGDRVRVIRADAEWLPNKGWEGGDGTVPAISATPVEYSTDDGTDTDDAIYHRSWCPEPHLPLASADGVVRFLARFEAAPLGAVRGEPEPDRPWVGFDVDDVTAAGVPSVVAVRLCGADPAGVAARIRLVPERGAPVELTPERDGGRWRAAVPGLSAGAHRLLVELNQVPVVDRVTGEDVLGVIEP